MSPNTISQLTLSVVGSPLKILVNVVFFVELEGFSLMFVPQPLE